MSDAAALAKAASATASALSRPMGGGRLPPPVHVVLGPSRLLGAAIGVAALATLALVLLLPLAPWQHALACAAVLGWAWRAFRVEALREGPRATTELRVAHNLVVSVRRGDGRLVAGHVRSATYVGGQVTSLVWRPDGARFSRSVLILPDMLPAEDFRRLRVLLRYARSGRAQDSPASQA